MEDSLTEFNNGEHVCFARGPVEFIGTVVASDSAKVTVVGVEPGCLSSVCETVEIARTDALRPLPADEWEKRIANEPAYAHDMSKERFMALEAELEALEKNIASGFELASTDPRVQEIELLMDKSPWVLHPDDGCIPKWTANPVKPLSNGQYIGKVVSVDDGVVIQDAGRGQLVSHELDQFEKPPKVGDKLEIRYMDKVIAAAKELSQDGHSVSMSVNTR